MIPALARSDDPLLSSFVSARRAFALLPGGNRCRPKEAIQVLHDVFSERLIHTDAYVNLGVNSEDGGPSVGVVDEIPPDVVRRCQRCSAADNEAALLRPR